jgi:hypothetical protein
VLFQNEETTRLLSLVAEGAKQWTRAELDFVKTYGQRQKPPTLDDVSILVADLYSGNQEKHLAQAIRKRFKNGADSMSGVVLNRMRHVASSDSGVYRQPPDRVLIDAATKQPVTGPLADAFAALVKKSEINSIAPEVERRAVVAQTIFVRVQWSSSVSGNDGRIKFDAFWPHDVNIVCHSSDPSNFSLCFILLARVASPDGNEWYSLWTRTPVENEFGELLSFSPWRVHSLNEKGEYTIPPDDPRTLYVDAAGNPLPLPWSVVQIGLAEGSVFVRPDNDLPKYLLDLNVDATAERLKHDILAHTPLVYAGTSLQNKSIPWGAGELVKLLDGETLTPLALDAHLADSRDMRTQLERDLAKVRGNNPNAYAAPTGAPESGIARLIAQAPHEAILDENSLKYQAWEENQIWPIALTVHDAFSGLPPFGDVAVAVAMKRPPPIEEPAAKQSRVRAEYEDGIISHAQYAVEMGRFSSVADAVAAGLSDKLGGEKVSPGIPNAFSKWG